MKQLFTISISEPCNERWFDFSRTDVGGFCGSCCKEVIDFTNMSEEEIKHYFKDTEGRVCGRFEKSQLKSYAVKNIEEPVFNWNWFAAGLLGIALLSSPSRAKAELFGGELVEVVQNNSNQELGINVKSESLRLIKGRIVDETGEALPGATIYLKGSNVGTLADLEGYFELEGDFTPGDILVVSFIGFDTVEYKIPKDAPNELVIPMLTLSCQLMGEVILERPYEEPSRISKVWKKLTGWI